MRMMKLGAVLSGLLMSVSCGVVESEPLPERFHPPVAVESESSPEELETHEELQTLLDSETLWVLRHSEPRGGHAVVQPIEGGLLVLDVMDVRGTSLQPGDEVILTPRGLERFRARGPGGEAVELSRQEVARALASQGTPSLCGARKMMMLARGSLRGGAQVELILGASLYKDPSRSALMMDGGTYGGSDAGVDAGTDGGVDAGVDAGTGYEADAGVDAGTDAGTEMGTDAGTPSNECRKGNNGTCVGTCPDLTIHNQYGSFRYSQYCQREDGWFSWWCECKVTGPVHG